MNELAKEQLEYIFKKENIRHVINQDRVMLLIQNKIKPSGPCIFTLVISPILGIPR